MNNMQVKSIATVFIWITYMVLIFLGMESLGAWVSLLAFVLMMPMVVALGAMWGMFGNQSQSDEANQIADTEKRKRERLDTVLRDLSDEDLLMLRKRLQEGSIDDGVLYDRLIGDDGEIVNRYDTN